MVLNGVHSGFFHGSAAEELEKNVDRLASQAPLDDFEAMPSLFSCAWQGSFGRKEESFSLSIPEVSTEIV